MRLTPRGWWAGRDGLDGAANAALIAFLAQALDCWEFDTALIAGEHARLRRQALASVGVELGGRVTAWVSLST